MRAIVTPTHDSRVGILNGEIVASFPDGCPGAGEYDVELAAGWVNTTGEQRRTVVACTPASDRTESDEPDSPDPVFGHGADE